MEIAAGEFDAKEEISRISMSSGADKIVIILLIGRATEGVESPSAEYSSCSTALTVSSYTLR